MPTKRGWLGFVLVITSAAPLGAQATRGESARVGTVRGQVSAAESLTPLSHVSVTASGLETQTSAGVLTDDEGWFTLSGLAVGTYTLRVERLGYATLQLADVVVRSGRITFVEASLTAVPLEVEGLVVTGGFFPQPEDQPVSMSSYSGEEIRRAPGSAGDVSRIFMTLPSVAKVSDQSNGLAVRGGSPRENAFFVDNVEIPNINHFPTQGSSSGPIGLLNTDLIRDATFFTGGFPAPYGDRLSSVMEIELREGDRSEFDGQVDLSLAGAGVVVEGPLGDEGSASYVLSARKSFLDLLVDAIGTESDVVPRYSDGTLKIVWDEGARHRVTALGVGGIDEISASRAAAMENGQIVYGDHSGSEAAVGLDWRAQIGRAHV